MLHHLHTTLSSLLHARGQIPQAEVDVLFDIPSRQWVEALERPAVCCYMFDMAEVAEFRNAGAQVSRANGRAVTKLPPRRVDLRYLVCAFSSSRADEQLLVWRAMAVFMKHTTLPVDLMPEDLRKLDVPVTTKLGSYPEAPKTLDLWGALELPPRPALLLSVTAPLDLELEFEAPLVLTRITRFTRPSTGDQRGARGIDPDLVTRRGGVFDGYAPLDGVDAREQALGENLGDGYAPEKSLAAIARLLRGDEPQPREHARYRVAGILRDGHGQPLADMVVGVVGRAIMGETADDGSFSLANVPIGDAKLWLQTRRDFLAGTPPDTERAIDVQIPWAFDLDADARRALYHVGGEVRDARGRLVENVAVRVVDRGDASVTDRRGRFHLALPAGPARLALARGDRPIAGAIQITVPTAFDIVLLEDAEAGS